MMCELDGAPIKLLVGELPIATRHCHGVRCARGLLREKLMQTSVARVLGVRAVPLPKRPMALVCSQNRQLRHVRRRARRNASEESEETGDQPLDGLPVEQVFRILQRAFECARPLVNQERQVKLRAYAAPSRERSRSPGSEGSSSGVFCMPSSTEDGLV